MQAQLPAVAPGPVRGFPYPTGSWPSQSAESPPLSQGRCVQFLWPCSKHEATTRRVVWHEKGYGYTGHVWAEIPRLRHWPLINCQRICGAQEVTLQLFHNIMPKSLSSLKWKRSHMAIKQLQLQNPLPEYETNHTQQLFATPNKVRSICPQISKKAPVTVRRQLKEILCCCSPPRSMTWDSSLMGYRQLLSGKLFRAIQSHCSPSSSKCHPKLWNTHWVRT